MIRFHRPVLSSSFLALALATLPVTPGCGESSSSKAQPQSSALPAGLLASVEPTGALKVLDLRKSAPTAGSRVAVIGRIGGSRAPFVSTKAIFTIVDPTLESCVEMGDDDHCPRPWDYCCEPKSEVSAALASIEVVGGDGKPLPIALDASGELKPLMLVAVEGTLQPSDGTAFVVRADKIYKFPNDPLARHIK